MSVAQRLVDCLTLDVSRSEMLDTHAHSVALCFKSGIYLSQRLLKQHIEREFNILAFMRIRTPNPSNGAAEDVRLRRLSHLDLQAAMQTSQIIVNLGDKFR
jgi:hypothetical protein